MKKAFKFLLAMCCVFTLAVSFYACDFLPKPSGTPVEITLQYNDGVTTATIDAVSGQPLSTPDAPTRENHIFLGWFSDENCTTPYDFSKTVNKPFTLYAGWVLDSVKLINQVSMDAMKGVVKIENRCTTSVFGEGSASLGSGFIFQIASNKYYILTNCHVVEKASGTIRQTLTVYDYQNNEFTGTLVASSTVHDLACLYFSATAEETNANALSFGSAPKLNDYVIALGAPQSQTNCITIGKVTKESVRVDIDGTEYSNVLRHDAYTNHGSSGGPLLDVNLKVVGVTFAGDDEAQTEDKSFALPLSYVNDFLQTYVYN